MVDFGEWEGGLVAAEGSQHSILQFDYWIFSKIL